MLAPRFLTFGAEGNSEECSIYFKQISPLYIKYQDKHFIEVEQ